MPPRRFLPLLLASMLLAACAQPQTDLKPGAMDGWWTTRIDGSIAHEYLQARWGIVFSGEVEVAILPSGLSIDVRSPHQTAPESATKVGSGAAVHVGRGYWLTAAHCVPHDTVRLVRLAPLEPAVMPGRVVWRNADPGHSGDLALLRIDMSGLREPVPAIRLSPAPPDSGSVLCLGTGLETSAWSGGFITGLQPGSDLDIRIISHNAPIGPGDSGGPAMLPSGEIAGINVLALRRIQGQPKSWAIWISPDRLQQIIEQVEASGP